MGHIPKTGARLALAAAAATGLVAAGVPAADATVHQTAGASGVPTLQIAVTDNSMYVDGPSTFPAGRVKLSLENAQAKKDAAVQLLRLAPGYSFHDWRTDIARVGRNLFSPNGNKKKGLRALNHAIKHATVYGGLVAGAGRSEHSMLLVPQGTGQVYVFDDSGNVPRRRHALTVTYPSGPQTLPTPDATVVAKTNRRFGGSKVLPANGNITFRNLSTESPHFLSLVHVKNGTTRKQVINGFQSNNPPNFFLPGEEDTDVVTSGQAMRLHLHLPKGQYAEMCFFPDPKTGMPHAFMGMVRMVHLR